MKAEDAGQMESGVCGGGAHVRDCGISRRAMRWEGMDRLRHRRCAPGCHGGISTQVLRTADAGGHRRSPIDGCGGSAAWGRKSFNCLPGSSSLEPKFDEEGGIDFFFRADSARARVRPHHICPPTLQAASHNVFLTSTQPLLLRPP